jgi:hypothetical protein
MKLELKSCYHQNNLLKVNSKFRVGFDHTNKDINDIIFSNIFNNFTKFSNELIKYLQKIK